MCEILLWKRPDKEGFDVEESVLSFNYTRAVSVFRSDEHVTNYVNIHGRLGGDIIFGIDGTDRMDKPIAMPFTKTYRLMALDLPDTSSIVHIPPKRSLSGQWYKHDQVLRALSRKSGLLVFSSHLRRGEAL